MTGENDTSFEKTAAYQKLRQRAEAKVAGGDKPLADMSASEMSTIIHELRIHQVELEVQNEELRKRQAETEKSHKAYRDLWELSPVGYLIVDLTGRITAVNRAAQRLFGRPEKALLKARFSRLVTPENQVPVHQMLERALETGSVEKQEIRISKPDGAIHICLLEVISLGGAPGREQIQAVLTDITRQKRAEEALHKAKDKLEITVAERTAALIEANAKLRQEIDEHKRLQMDLHETQKLLSNTFNAIQDMVVVIDKDFRVIVSNWKGHDYISEKDRRGYPYCYEVIMHRDKPCINCHALEVFAIGETKQPEGTNPIDGKIRDIRVFPMLDDKGKVVAVIEHLRDITGLKQSEETLRENEEKYRELFENESDALMIFDAETLRFEDASRATLELYGYSKEDFLALTVEDISAEKEKTKIIVGKIVNEKSYTKQLPLRYFFKKDGTVFPGEISAGVFFTGGRKKIIGAVRDRTELMRMRESLQESENRFRELFNNMRNGVAVYRAVNDGEDFVIVDFNKVGERIDNLERQDLIGKSLLDTFPGVKEVGLLDVFQRVWRTGKPEHHPVSFYQDGRISGWRENFVYRLASGEIVAVYEDITERIQAQQALRESEARFRALSEATFEAIFISENGVCLDANQRASELFGYNYDELIGIFGTAVIAAESKELVGQNMLSGYEKPYEAIAQKKDGTKFHVEIRGKMMRYKDKEVRITVIRDIDEQKRAAEALRKSENRYRDLFNSIPVGLYRTTPQGSILDVNPALVNILGYPDRDDLLQAKSLETYVDPDDRKQFQHLLEEQGFVHDFAVRLCRHDGNSIWVSINTSIVHDTDSQVTYYEGAMADISARKASEEQIHKLSQQLIQAQEDERHMISHELHDTVAQDLSVAKMACDLIYAELLSKRLPEAQRIQEICAALQKTITGVRNLAYELRPPVLEELGLVEAIYRFCEEFTQLWGLPVDFQSAGLKNLKLDYAIQINIYRLVQEGLTNIRKHADAGRVTLRLAAAFPNIILRIEDNGRGFDVQKRAAVLGQEKRMGLRSMQERVNLMNGLMKLHSKPGLGTKVTIKLPIGEKKRDV